MAVDMFIKIDGIKGEATDAKHKDEIDVLNWSWGVSNSGSMQSTGAGGGAGKANFQDLSLTKWLDSSSPKLLGASSTGKHLKEALLTVRKVGEKPLEYLKITLSDCLISSVSTGGAGSEDRLTEHVSISFAKVKVEYTPQGTKGEALGVVPFGYDLKKNELL
jgi:type VI secretion system secreted protein Hcp